MKTMKSFRIQQRFIERPVFEIKSVTCANTFDLLEKSYRDNKKMIIKTY